jgi:HSP20 family protein
MDLAKWDPFREMEDFFRGYGWGRRHGQGAPAAGDWVPRVDIAETGEAFSIQMEVAGVKKEDVSVTVDGGVLTIRGERKRETEEAGRTFHRVERLRGGFARSFKLPENVDEAGIGASFKEGVLTITLPKTAVSKAKAIEVQVQ